MEKPMERQKRESMGGSIEQQNIDQRMEKSQENIESENPASYEALSEEERKSMDKEHKKPVITEATN